MGRLAEKQEEGRENFTWHLRPPGSAGAPRTEKCQRIYQGGCLRGRHVTRVFTRPKGTRAETLMELASILIRFF